MLPCGNSAISLYRRDDFKAYVSNTTKLQMRWNLHHRAHVSIVYLDTIDLKNSIFRIFFLAQAVCAKHNIEITVS